ncbi:MAG: ribonuclease J [Alphaproteobacteria bacterium]
MSDYLNSGTPGADELLFLPLGGAGEIGMNLNLYGHAGKWLMVDFGITFGDDTTPGVDIITPDPTFIAERKDQLAGLILTHAHEDHLGAVPYLWPRIECPIYATAFTASVLRRKLSETSFGDRVEINVIPLSGRFSVGPFELELITLTHSIPEPNAVVLRTAVGSVMHTGDWKIDPDPVVGLTTDEQRLIEVGEEGVLAMVCDSTNVFVPGTSGSEGDVRENLEALVAKCERRVVVACFASNVARLETIARVGEATDRSVALVGRSLWRIYEAAKENGYLTDIPPFITEKDVGYMPPDRVLMICTGSQGEPRAALPRIAGGEHRDVALETGDTVIFSSRVIPGNEMAIGRLHNRLISKGIEVITASDAAIHVSGHPARDELVQMYNWIRPQIAVPVHGEARHMIAHAKLARDCQVPQPIVTQNGSMVRLAPGRAEIIDEVFSDRLAIDGNRLVPMDSQAIKARRRMTHHGTAVATVVIDEHGDLIRDPVVTVNGVYDEDDDDEVECEVVDAVIATIEDMRAKQRRDDEFVSEMSRRAVRRCIRALCGKNPHTEIHLIRV